MRKDVKFGFAIGGVLLAVLIVYVLVVPADKNQIADVAPSGNASTPTANQQQPTDATRHTEPQTPVTVTPTPTTVTPSAPQTDSYTRNSAGETPSAGATPPADDTRWQKLLNGQVMLGAEQTSAGANASSSSNSSSNTMVAGADPDHTPPAMATDNTTSSATTRPSDTITSSSSGQRTHTVQRHETLSAISTVAYGSPIHWKEIATANPKIDPNHLKVGTELTLPAIQSQPTVRPTDDTTAAAHDPTVTGNGATAPIDSTHEYRVRAGDSLHAISTKLYGKADRWQKIYELNKETIGAAPEHLKVNMVLKLPEPPTVASSR